MSNRRRQSAAVALDMGPSIRLIRGDVVVLDRPDPATPNRTVRAARARTHYDALWKRGGLADAEREAADKYAVLCEIEAGARDRSGEAVGRLPPWMQGQPTLTQVQAVASLRGVHGAIGADGMALLRLYVRDNLPAAEIAGRRRETEPAVIGRIKAALTRAAEHWEMA
jgi:hypothetical protein